MKRNLFTLMLACGVYCAGAQSSAGLIAHWDMNGTTHDTSGGGHHGHPLNLTSATGRDGIAGHAWYFNGTNSGITIPQSPAFNVSRYTLSATIKVMGYYAGPCHANMILTRGKAAPNVTGNYYLDFNDDPAGYGCASPSVDTTKQSFMSAACGTGVGLVPASNTAYNTTPHILSNVWYDAVATFNDTVYKMYVNGVLMATVPITNPGVPIGTSSDSMSIGFAVYDAAVGYPYYFKGVMDDILFYNRVLSDSEIVHIHDTCGSITVQPVTVMVPVAGTVNYSVTSTIVSGTYQWQQNTGSGFVNLSNSGPYSGVTTNVLTVTGVTSAMGTYHYRCLVTNSVSCSDTSSEAALTLGVDDISNNTAISAYPNPVHTMLTVTAAGIVNNIVVSNVTGQVVYTAKPNKQATDIDVSHLANGLYFIRINNAEVRKFIKQ